MKPTRREHEDIAKRIITFHISSANSILKTTVSHFLKQKIPRQTIYDILKKYNLHKTRTFLSKSGRPAKISDKEVQSLVKTVNNKTGISQRRLGRQFGEHQSTISRTLKKRTSVKIFTRRKAPKYRDEKQKHRAQSNSCTLYKILKPDVQLILDDEKYFSLNGDIACYRKYYTTDRSTALPKVKFKTKIKFEPKLLVWMAVSQKGISSIYVHRSTIAIKQETYLHDCIRKRLLPFINHHHKNDNVLFWPDLASSHYSKQGQEFLQANNIKFVERQQNPPNVPQARPIETIWSLVEQKLYEGTWQAKNLEQLSRRVILKAKQLDQDLVTSMI